MTSRAGRKDLELVQRAVSEHHAFVYRLAYRMVRNPADAEDVTQTVFVELLRSPGALARVASPRAWLARVTFSKAASIKRGESRRRKREETWAKDRPSKADGDDMNTNDDVNEAIASLPDELRVPVILHYQEGLKYREIAEVCQCAEGTVASRISTAREKLREKLKHGGALAGFPSIEAALEAGDSIPVPAGLEAKLLEGVSRELAMAGSGARAAARAAGNRTGAFAGGTAFTVAASFVLAGTLMTGGWLGIRGALERDSKDIDATAVSAIARPEAAPAAIEGSAEERIPAVARRRGGPSGAASVAAPAEDEGEAEEAAATGAPASPVVLGWVRDRRGRPLEGVTVGVVPPGGDAPARTTTTDAEGYYELDGVSPAQKAITFLNDGSASYVRTLKEDLESAALTLDATTGALAALNEAEEKQAYLVKLEAEQAKLRALETVQVQYDLAVRKQADLANALRATRWFARNDSASMQSAACPEGNTAGTCSSCHADAGFQEPVQVWHADGSIFTADALVGKFEHVVQGERLAFLTAMSGGHRIVAQLDGYRVEVSEPFEVKEGEPVEVDLTLEATLAITGSVLGADGVPIAEADVAVVGHAGDQLLPGSATRTQTDADGGFALGSLPAGVYAVRVAAAGFEPVEAIASTGTHAPFVLHFTGSARVTVTRRETGEPLSGFHVELRKEKWVVAQAVTGEDGVASLADVPQGNYIATTCRESSGSRQTRGSGEITVFAREESAIGIEVASKVKAAGRVSLRDPDASPAGHSVKATRLDDAGEVDANPKVVRVAEDGSFKWSGGLAPGDYIIELHAGEKGSGEAIGSMDLEVEAGRDIVDLVIAEGAERPAAPAARRGESRESAAPPPRPFDPIPLEDRTVTVQEPMKLRTLVSLLGAAGVAVIVPSAEVEGSGVLDHARVESTGPFGFQGHLRGALEGHGLRWAASGTRVAIEMSAAPGTHR